MLGLVGPVLAGRETGKCAEVMDEMGLVIIAAIKSNARPIDLTCHVDGLQHALKAAYAAKGLGSEADLLMEELNKPARTETDSIRHGSYFVAGSGMAKFLQGKRYGGVQFQWANKLLQQAPLQHS